MLTKDMKNYFYACINNVMNMNIMALKGKTKKRMKYNEFCDDITTAHKAMLDFKYKDGVDPIFRRRNQPRNARKRRSISGSNINEGRSKRNKTN